jgi:hypothetical protein
MSAGGANTAVGEPLHSAPYTPDFPSLSFSIGDVVTVTITGDSPIGVILSADPEGYAAVIKSWARLPNGKFGPIQKVSSLCRLFSSLAQNGGVHIGDVLFAINDTKLTETPHAEVAAMLSSRHILQKNLKFMNGGEYLRQKSVCPAPPISLLTPSGEASPDKEVFSRALKRTSRLFCRSSAALASTTSPPLSSSNMKSSVSSAWRALRWRRRRSSSGVSGSGSVILSNFTPL